MDKQKKLRLGRKLVQGLSALAQNPHLTGFARGTIYTGRLKQFCTPGLNCYSCPAAAGACPIGSLQAVLGGKHRFPFSVVGFLSLIGLLVGRLVCGWLCLFGLLQELLYRIPAPKLKLNERTDRRLRKLKYLLLIVAVFLLPAVTSAAGGGAVPYFCKYVCPAGTVEGGIPLLLLQNALRTAVGWLFAWKLLVLLAILVLSVFIYRPFCKYLCPLGAFYAIFQKFSVLRLARDPALCTDCGVCAKRCKMGVDPAREPNSPECIRCGACTAACPAKALKFTVSPKKKPKDSPCG